MNEITYNRDVNVEQEDIDGAVPRNQYQCAIVRAIQRQYPQAIRVTVNSNKIGFTIREDRFVYPTPPEAVEAIIKPLDTGGTPHPITLQLRGGVVKDVQASAPSSEQARIQHRDYERKVAADRKRKMTNRSATYGRF